MRWANNRKLEFYLKYDERNCCWIARVQESNRKGFTKRFKTCTAANKWYADFKEKYCEAHGI